MRLLGLALLVSLAVTAASLIRETDTVDKDIQLLGELEDLLNRDGNIKAYFEPEAGHVSHERTPESLLRQFSTAKRSPAALRRLKKLRQQLTARNSALAARIPNQEVKDLIGAIDDSLGKSALRTTCDATTLKFRTIDGSCNNLGEPEQGSAETPLLRLVSNAYDDGLSKPRSRKAAGLGSLPNPRAISKQVIGGSTKQIKSFTSIGVHFGQLTDHDLTASESQEVECEECEMEGECFAIRIYKSDPVFGRVQKCFPFIRANHEEDPQGVRQQINEVTTWLDASFVYGSDELTAELLRDDFGLLRHLTDGVTGRDLLPPNKELTLCAGVDEDAGIFCGLAGDGRVAEQPGLTSLHTLFLREHNRIARQLRDLGDLSDEEIYQTARRIVGAEWQHILYNEYLPQIIGETLYRTSKLGPNAPFQYEGHQDASIANVFAAAAFRFGHTEIPDVIMRASKRFQTDSIPQIKVAEAFFNASYIFDESIPDGAVDSILRGMTIQQLDLVDRQLTSAVTENLFGDPDVKGDGMDLVSLNIQRARDHGLPSYAVIREELVGAAPIYKYSDLKGVMSRRNIKKLRKAYGKHGVRDIDAFVGFILEEHLPNALVGPTLATIFANQFRRLKFGDRFFYTNPHQFTLAERTEIKKASMARLMCDNVEGVTKIQPSAFLAATVDSVSKPWFPFKQFSWIKYLFPGWGASEEESSEPGWKGWGKKKTAPSLPLWKELGGWGGSDESGDSGSSDESGNSGSSDESGHGGWGDVGDGGWGESSLESGDPKRVRCSNTQKIPELDLSVFL